MLCIMKHINFNGNGSKLHEGINMHKDTFARRQHGGSFLHESKIKQKRNIKKR